MRGECDAAAAKGTGSSLAPEQGTGPLTRVFLCANAAAERAEEPEESSGSDEEEAVMDLRSGAAGVDSEDESESDDDSEDDDDEDSDDGATDARVAQRSGRGLAKRSEADAESDEDSEDDSEEDEVDDDDEARALGKQVRDSTLTSAWGADRTAYYEGGEGDDDDDAAEEEEQAAVAMMRARAAEMDEEDFASGALAAGRLAALASGAASAGDALPAGKHTVSRDASTLSDAERAALLDADAPELRRLVADLADRASALRRQLTEARAAQAASRPAQGVPLLEARLQLLLLYMAHVSFFLVLRAEGAPARTHPVVRRLVRLRGLLERTRPLVARMRPRIDRAVRAAQRKAAGQSAGSRDEDLAAPGLDELAAGAEGSDEEQEAGSSRKRAPGASSGGDAKFRPSKLAAVPYTGDEGKSGKADKEAERRRRRAERSEALQEMRMRASERPEEQDMAGAEVLDMDDDASDGEGETRGTGRARLGAAADGGGFEDRALAAREEERRRFEEENFVRLGMSKEERKARSRRDRERQRFTALGDIGGAVDNLMDSLRDEATTSGAAPGKSLRGAAGTSAAKELERQQAGMERFAREVKGAAVRAAKRRRPRAGEDDDEEAVGGGPDRWAVGGGASLGGDAEDDLYAAAERLAASRRAARQSEREERFEHRASTAREAIAEAATSGDKREITREIRTNRGLTKYRKKEARNPRVANRIKADRQAKRRKSAVPEARREGDAGYDGEATGVRSGISRSRIM